MKKRLFRLMNRHFLYWFDLFSEFPGTPDDQAGSADRKEDAGDPAAADADQVTQESADETADNTEQRVAQKTLGTVIHELIGSKSGNGTDAQGNQQTNQHNQFHSFFPEMPVWQDPEAVPSCVLPRGI